LTILFGRSLREGGPPSPPPRTGPSRMSEAPRITVTKKELVTRIAEQTGQTKVVVKEVMQCLLDEIVEELSRGNRLEFREFGVFEVRLRAARQAQNPRTLEKVLVPAKRVVKFKVGRLMRERVCGEEIPFEVVEPEPEPPKGDPPLPPPSNSPF
jgi:integration host factor subunit beta